MKRKADELFRYDGPNPFSDSQPRNYSDTKILGEFFPTSCFWSLFNDQHEVLIGSRGSGKTYLLKAMRRSMLKRICDPKAAELVKNKSFFALYVPMHLETLSEFKKIELQIDRFVTVYQFFFNCLLSESIIQELEGLLDEDDDKFHAIQAEGILSRQLDSAWFGEYPNFGSVTNLKQLAQKVRNLYYSFELVSGDLSKIPPVFKRQICTPLISVKALIADTFSIKEEPTWIVCVDEAEFLNEVQQMCINSVFRADSNRIALKVATLPFYHKTLETLVPGIRVCAGNDFNYRFVDMRHDSEEFKVLTNRLCAHRLKTRLAEKTVEIDSIEDFLGKIGNDDLIDYYREEVGDDNATHEAIEQQIISNFSSDRRKGSETYSNKRKTVYDKFTTIFFVREMYTRSCSGNSKPGWYAGSSTVRKISQGNPRLFIQLMNALFEKARITKLTPKAQHEVILKFSEDFCNATKGLDYNAYVNLDAISSKIKMKVHRKDKMVTTGCAFSLTSKNQTDFDCAIYWLEEAIAHSRLIVAEDALVNGLQMSTKYTLSNAYAAYYWLPMRTDSATRIPLDSLSSKVYENDEDHLQLSFLEEDAL